MHAVKRGERAKVSEPCVGAMRGIGFVGNAVKRTKKALDARSLAVRGGEKNQGKAIVRKNGQNEQIKRKQTGPGMWVCLDLRLKRIWFAVKAFCDYRLLVLRLAFGPSISLNISSGEKKFFWS